MCSPARVSFIIYHLGTVGLSDINSSPTHDLCCVMTKLLNFTTYYRRLLVSWLTVTLTQWFESRAPLNCGWDTGTDRLAHNCMDSIIHSVYGYYSTISKNLRSCEWWEWTDKAQWVVMSQENRSGERQPGAEYQLDTGLNQHVFYWRQVTKNNLSCLSVTFGSVTHPPRPTARA